MNQEPESGSSNTNWVTLGSSVQFSHSVVSDSLRPHESQHARPPCPSPTPGVHPNPCPLCRWCYPPSHPLSSPSPLALNLSQHQGLFKWVSSPRQVAKVLEFQLQHSTLDRPLPSHWFSVVLFVKWGVEPNGPLSFDGLSCLSSWSQIFGYTWTISLQFLLPHCFFLAF